VGRDPELDILLVEFVTAKRTGGRTVAICGEGGIGKSRLIDTFCEKLERATYLKSAASMLLHHTFSPLYPSFVTSKMQPIYTLKIFYQSNFRN
jgi:hypothetical protein